MDWEKFTSSSSAAAALSVTAGLGLAGALWYRRGRLDKKETSWKDEIPETTDSSTVVEGAINETDQVWEDRRRKGIAAASNHERKAHAKDKPFSSSYYYAHNCSSKTGGYKDGLTMEDFTMNGPRLLSRGGQTVSASSERDETESEDPSAEQRNANVSSDTATTESPSEPDKTRRVILISRYLWDDPGDSKGVATLRIEQLPDRESSSKLVSWQDAAISSVSAKLVSPNGLLVVALSEKAGIRTEYRLHIPNLYGDAQEVKALEKGNKRLLVKIYKKSGILDKSNLIAWPHPYKKA